MTAKRFGCGRPCWPGFLAPPVLAASRPSTIIAILRPWYTTQSCTLICLPCRRRNSRTLTQHGRVLFGRPESSALRSFDRRLSMTVLRPCRGRVGQAPQQGGEGKPVDARGEAGPARCAQRDLGHESGRRHARGGAKLLRQARRLFHPPTHGRLCATAQPTRPLARSASASGARWVSPPHHPSARLAPSRAATGVG